MGLRIQLPIQIMEDNQSCICIADNPISQRRTRHIDIRYHFIRDYILDGTITVKYCPTKQMLVDILTKSLHRPIFTDLRDRIIGNILEFIDNDLFVSLAYCQSIYNDLVSWIHTIYIHFPHMWRADKTNIVLNIEYIWPKWTSYYITYLATNVIQESVMTWL